MFLRRVMQSSKRAPLWFYLILLFLIVFNLYTIIGTLSETEKYTVLDIPFSPVLRIAIAVLWIMVFCALAIGLARHQSIAFMWVVPILSLHGIVNLIGCLLFARSDYSTGQVGFQSISTLFVLLPLWWIALRRGWMKYPKNKLDNNSEVE